MLRLVVTLALCGMVRADYDCLCSYNLETPVFSSGVNSSKKVGYMYEFDCKPILKEKGINSTAWQVVAFEHQKGYIHLDQQMQIQACPGDPSAADMLTTESPTSTSSPTTSPTTSKTASSKPSSLIPTTGPLQSSTYSTIGSTAPITQPTTTARSTNKTTAIPRTTAFSTTMTRSSAKSTSNSSAKPSTTTQTTSIHSMSPKTSTQQTTSTPKTTRQTTTSTSTKKVTTVLTTSRQTITQQSTTTMTRPSTASTSRTTAQQTTVHQTPSTHTTRQTSTQQTTSASTPSRVHTKVPTSTTTPSTTSQPMSTTKTTKSTSPTTTHWTTTRRSTTTSQPAVQLGNVGLCPSSVVQYAKQDNEILTQIRHSCYTVVPHKYSWPHAESECNRRGGHLFHISDRLENLAIYILLNTHFNHSVWMGLSDLNREEHFEWTSNIPLTFTNWMPGRKTIGHDFEDCAVFVPYVDHGKWDDVQCGGRNPMTEFFFEKHYFICQFPTHNAQTVAPTAVPTVHNEFIQGPRYDCPFNVRMSVNWEGGYLERYGTSCYERVPQRWTWNEANANCKHKGGHLLQIGSAQEEAAISHFLSHIDSQDAVWIGLHDQGHEETFTWTSGERLIYTNWLSSRKSIINHSVEDCVILLPYKQGMWDDIPCGRYYIDHGNYGEYHTEIHPYICEYHVTPGGPSLIGR